MVKKYDAACAFLFLKKNQIDYIYPSNYVSFMLDGVYLTIIYGGWLFLMIGGGEGQKSTIDRS